MKKILCVCSMALLSSSQLLADGNSTDPPNYNVNRTGAAAPVIDGVVSPDEWSAAAPGAGDWVNLRAHTADSHNLRFRMLWDDEKLYVLGQSDYDNYPEGPQDPKGNPNFGGGSYNPNFYFDPNTDGEDFDGEDYGGGNVDGYQFTWDIYEGHAERRPTPEDPDQSYMDPLDADGEFVNDYFMGLFLEAHVNTPFGNNGLYDLSPGELGPTYREDKHPGIVIAQNSDNFDLNGTGSPGAVWEVAISWNEFNATDPNRTITEEEADANPLEIEDTREFILDEDGFEIDNPTFGEIIPNPGYLGEAGDPDPRFSDPEHPLFRDNGLYAVDGPKSGDIWAFETSIITPDSDNFLPSWSEPLGGDDARSGFAPWGESAHGRITFVGGETTCEDLAASRLPGDADGNGEVAFGDFLALAGGFGTDAGFEGGDFDCNGEVAFADFLALANNFGATAAGTASAVPEPSSALLVGLAAMLMGLVRRRR